MRVGVKGGRCRKRSKRKRNERLMEEQVDDALRDLMFQNLSEYARDVEQEGLVTVNGQWRRRCRCRRNG